MAREKIQIRKIENATARQVTFSKRRRGLFKKAEELSILCDADVSVIVFSTAGKMFEYSSSSMHSILERRCLHSKNLAKIEHPCLDLQLVENSCYSMLSKDVLEKTKKLRQMRGEELSGLNVEELHHLEKSIELGLSRVIGTKAEKITKEIHERHRKNRRLMEENERLILEVGEVSQRRMVERGDCGASMESAVCEDRQSSESADFQQSSLPHHDFADFTDTSLKLGLPC